MIECTSYRPFIKGCLQGFADVFVPKWGLEIKGCSVYMKEGRRWINMPSKKFKTASGEDGFDSIIKFREKPHMDYFTKCAKDGIDKFIEENGIEESDTEKQGTFDDKDVQL